MHYTKSVVIAVAGMAVLTPEVKAQGAVLEEIVVTARKRAESFQDVPVAVTAFNAGDIEDAGIEKIRDFTQLTPNVHLVETQNQGNAFINIRGISQARNSEPSVAVVIDGVQMTQPAQFNRELFDIQSIQVLKGPQPLYGRNAIGGAIIIDTKQPTDQFEGRVEAGVDNGFGWKGKAALSGPVSDEVKFRASLSYVDTEGYIPNTYLGEEADPYMDISGRGRLLWEPTSDLSVELRGSASRTETQALYFNIVNDADDTSLPVRVNNPGQNDRDLYNVTLKMDRETEYGTLTSITAYDALDEILTGDQFDFLPIEESFFFTAPPAFGGLGVDLNQSQFLDVETISQELRFTSPSEDRFRYTVGGYVVGTDRFISTGNMVDMGEGVFPVRRTPSTNPDNPQATFLADSQENFAWAVFGNVAYDVTSDLELSASLRYDHDERIQTTETPPEFLPTDDAFTGQVREQNFDAWQPKVSLRYQPTRQVTLYGSFSRGFRSGGFNQTGVGDTAQAAGVVGVGDIFEKETANTYEAGVKGQFLDNRVNVSGAVFHTVAKGSYFFVFLPSNSTQNLGNIDKVKYTGFEAQASARLAEGLDVNLGLGYTDSKISDFPDPTVIGNEAPLVSEYTVNAGVQYRRSLGAGNNIDGVVRVDYQRIGETWWEPYNLSSRSPVDLVDARIGVQGLDWSVMLWSKNLFDKKYNAEFSPGPAPGNHFVFKAKPRRWGLDVSKTF